MAQQDPILFYVLIPVYKTEKYIRSCLNSVLTQTYQNFRMIIVDDGTPDKAGQICDEYAKNDSRIHVIHKENQGLISARRAAIHHVKENCVQQNAFFVFLDSDDTLRENALQTIASTIHRESCGMVVYGLMRVCDGKDISVFQSNPYVGTISDRRTLYKTIYSNAAYNPLCRKAIAVQLVEDLDYSPYYHISRAEDLLQGIPILAKCGKVVFISDILYNYTINPGSITQTFSLEKYVFDTTVRKEVWQAIDREPQMTEADKVEYLSTARFALRSEVMLIAGAKGTVAHKRQLFDTLRRDEYSAFLLQTVSGVGVLDSIRRRRDLIVILYAYLRAVAGGILRGIKRTLISILSL